MSIFRALISKVGPIGSKMAQNATYSTKPIIAKPISLKKQFKGDLHFYIKDRKNAPNPDEWYKVHKNKVPKELLEQLDEDGFDLTKISKIYVSLSDSGFTEKVLLCDQSGRELSYDNQKKLFISKVHKVISSKPSQESFTLLPNGQIKIKEPDDKYFCNALDMELNPKTNEWTMKMVEPAGLDGYDVEAS